MRQFGAWTSGILVILAVGCATARNWDRDGFVEFHPNARVADSAAFSLVSTSMTLKEVVMLLGAPAEITGSGMFYIHWLTPAGGRFTIHPDGLNRTNAVVWIITDKLLTPPQ